MAEERKSPWNSLEVVRLAASIMTPVAIVVIGYWVQSTVAERNRTWQLLERLADRRMEVYDNIGEPLNRIYCYIEDIGTYKDETPDEVVDYKRTADRWMYMHEAIWSPDTFKAYTAYMDSAFRTHQGAVRDARIRSGTGQKELLDTWEGRWHDRFTGVPAADHRKNYEQLIQLISRDLMLLDPGMRPAE